MGGTKAVAHGELDGHDTAEAVHEGNEVGKMVGADQAEVAWVLGLEEVGLLVLGCKLSVGGQIKKYSSTMHSQGCCATSLAVFSTPLGTPDLLDMLAVAVGCFAWVTRSAE